MYLDESCCFLLFIAEWEKNSLRRANAAGFATLDEYFRDQHEKDPEMCCISFELYNERETERRKRETRSVPLVEGETLFRDSPCVQDILPARDTILSLHLWSSALIGILDNAYQDSFPELDRLPSRLDLFYHP
ncbi:hypothetical protein RHMOL_Rhmol04G0344700 [Rhododendron molle]|uniref:Uncharacterized protein n=1 Tax=Rhododendron molle TaxID=49168 RepID=A0ACC0P910_RHOML|nr:hypothetical protein RHMOL_Rhmol04G0344700 [Rhododendron molle]